MKRVLFVFALLVALPLAAFAQETTTVFDADAFEKTAERAQGVVEEKAASSEAMEELRLQLVAFRTQAVNQKSLAAAKVTPIFSRIQALGPTPAEGETEAFDVANLRSELETQLKNRRAPVLAAEESYKRADGLIKQIDMIIRERTTTELISQSRSPLSPQLIGDAFAALGIFGGNLIGEIKANMVNPTRQVGRWQNLVVVCALFCAALLLLRSRRWSRDLEHMLVKNASPSTGALLSFIGSLSQLILPTIGLFILVQSLLLLDLFDLRGYFMLRSLGIAGFALFFAAWLSRSLFVPSSTQPALIETTQQQAQSMRWSFLALGLMFALREMLDAMVVGSGQNPPVVAAIPTLTFPLIVFGGIALFRIGRVIGHAARVSSKSEGGNPFLGRIASIMGNLCVFSGVAGPILAAIGYKYAGEMLVFSTAQSLLLITGLYIVFRLIGTLSGNVTGVVVAAGSQEETQRYGALFRVSVGFIMICVAVPALALIWGARVSDLQEIWLLLRNGISVGDTRISLTDFLTFVLIFSIGFTITRVLQSALRTTVLPNTRMDVGGQNAIVTGTGYVGIFLASIAAITATGLDLSNLAIVAGALSVGIGFGLQTIVSNFVSGIILLIERPIKAGDWIEVGVYSGYVRKISVRSTEVETFDRASVVIPNADLIAGAVTNWTHSSMAGRVRVPVGVAYDSDPRHVEKVLREVAEAHPMVLLDPAPVIMFMGFGADSMNFEIRAILRDVNWMLSATSDMNFAIVKSFREEGIEIPFAQRDVYIKNLDQLGAARSTDPKTEVLEQGSPIPTSAPSRVAMDSSEGEGDK